MNAATPIPVPTPEAVPLVRPVVRQGKGYSARFALGRRALGPLAIVAIWAIATTAGWVDPSILPSPPALAEGFRQLWTEQNLLGQLGVSLGRALAGGTAGIVVGLALGIAAGLSRLGEELFDAALQMLRTIPFLALVPLFIVWFGIGEAPKITLIAVATVFPIYLNLFSGIRAVDVRLIEAARSFGLSQTQQIIHVILPGALPSFLVGLRYAMGVALLVLVVAEQINASAGLGHLINTARDFMRTDIIVVCLLVYAALGLAADLIVRSLEQHALAWRPSFIKS